MTHLTPIPVVLNERIWCPFCESHVQLLRIQRAAKLADVNRRTIYRYIDEGKVYTVRIAGGSYRLCSSCLIKENIPSVQKV